MYLPPNMPQPNEAFMMGEVLVERYTDNAVCLEVLRDVAPQLIDTLPVEASFRQPGGRSTIAMRTLLADDAGLAIVVLYYGYGCDKSDNGWCLIIFPCNKEQLLSRCWDIKRVVAEMSGADDPGPYKPL